MSFRGAIPTTRNYPAISTNEASAIFGRANGENITRKSLWNPW